MRELKDRIAVITGAASGIGRALALELARHGAQLALSDVNQADLLRTVEEIEGLGASVFTETVDVGG